MIIEHLKGGVMKTKQIFKNAIASGFNPQVQSQSARKYSFSCGNNTAVSGTLSDFMISNPVIIDETPSGEIKRGTNKIF